MLKYSTLVFIRQVYFRSQIFGEAFYYKILLDTTVLPDTGASTEPSKRNIDIIKDRILLLHTETLPFVSISLSHLVVFLLPTYIDIKGSTTELIFSSVAFRSHRSKHWNSQKLCQQAGLPWHTGGAKRAGVRWVYRLKAVREDSARV
jgi:hypothetical protein